MEDTPGSDVLMDWTPTKATVILASPPKRKFDEILDATTPYGRDDASPQQQLQQQYESQRYGLYGNDSNMGIIPRYGRRLAIWIYAITYFTIMATVVVIGAPFENTAFSIKRRFVERTQITPADAPPTTPRRRKYRNIYVTPRKRYEQRSARSCKIRDIPGRFPGTPLTTYSPRSSSPQSALNDTSPATLPPDSPQLPGSYPDSPLQQNSERRLEAMAIARDVREYGQDCDDESPILRHIPQTEIRSGTDLASAATKMRPVMPPLQSLKKRVGFYESPKTGGPVTRTKRFAIGESIDYPSPSSTRDESSMMSNHSPDTVFRYQSLLNAQLQPSHSLEPRSSGGGMPCDATVHKNVKVEPNGIVLPEAESTHVVEPIQDKTDSGTQSQSPTGDSIGNPNGIVSPGGDSKYMNEPIKDESDESPESQGPVGKDEELPEKRKLKSLWEQIRPRRRMTKKRLAKKSSMQSFDELLAGKSLRNNSSGTSLPGRFEALELDPRRTLARQRELAKREALEHAAREKREAEEKAQREKEDAKFRAQLEREHDEDLKRQGVRRFTREPIIRSLTAEQDERLNKAMAKGQKVTALNGTELSSRDWKTVLPSDAWLNDNIIVAYLEYVVKMAHERVGLKRNEPPKMHAFNNNFFNNLRSQGYSGVARWTRRPKIQGKALLPLEYVFIPVNASGNHWTLAVISPVRRTIEYFDSLHMPGQQEKVITLMKAWLKGELGDAYHPDEWKVREDEGPHQGNFSDCGVHTVTTAKLIALGIDPMAAPAEVMATQRRRMVAELLNSGFHGEYEVDFEFA